MAEKMILTQRRLGVSMRQSMEYESEHDISCVLLHHLTAFALTEHLQSTTQAVEQSAPATWWDHWKFAHPTWTRRLKMKPAQFTTITQRVTFVCEALYPQANIAVPDLGRPVIFERVEREW